MTAHRHIHDARTDPSGTNPIIRRYDAEIRKRFTRLKRLINEAMVKRDVLGLAGATVDSMAFMNMADVEAPPREAFAARSDSRKIAAFMAWLRQAVKDGVLEVSSGTPVKRAAQTSWQNIYIRSAYKKGVTDAAGTLSEGGATVRRSWITGAFDRPIHADRIGMIFTRAYSDLTGITDAMDAQISQVLAQGMAEGRGSAYIARRLIDRVDKIGVTRARAMARTEVMRAHAGATLNGYREAKAEGVILKSEFSTAGDAQVCPECSALEGNEYSMDEADGIIPVHVNCRCVWLPVVSMPDGTVLE